MRGIRLGLQMWHKGNSFDFPWWSNVMAKIPINPCKYNWGDGETCLHRVRHVCWGCSGVAEHETSDPR